MIEQSLAALFTEFAEELKFRRTELVSLVPEVDELCAGLDDLTEFLESKSRALLAEDAAEKRGPR